MKQINRSTLSFDLIDEFYEPIQIIAEGTGKSNSEVVENMAKTGALLLFVDPEFQKANDRLGVVMCRMLASYKIKIKIQRLKSKNYCQYANIPIEDIEADMRDRVKGPKTRIAVSLDLGFMRYLTWMANERKWSIPHIMAILMQQGMALDQYAKSEPSQQFPLNTVLKAKEILNHIVIYNKNANGVEVKKISSNTHINFIEIENPASSSGLQGMTKTPTNLSKKDEFL